jgi:hypothetical protein
MVVVGSKRCEWLQLPVVTARCTAQVLTLAANVRLMCVQHHRCPACTDTKLPFTALYTFTL